jgi:hypothetical protein
VCKAGERGVGLARVGVGSVGRVKGRASAALLPAEKRRRNRGRARGRPPDRTHFPPSSLLATLCTGEIAQRRTAGTSHTTSCLEPGLSPIGHALLGLVPPAPGLALDGDGRPSRGVILIVDEPRPSQADQGRPRPHRLGLGTVVDGCPRTRRQDVWQHLDRPRSARRQQQRAPHRRCVPTSIALPPFDFQPASGLGPSSAGQVVSN